MMRPLKIKGHVWLIIDDAGNPIHNIDTDMIFHNSHLHITEVSEMGNYAFGNLPGWEDFSTKCANGDVLFVGKNFGSGSSRQQAVDCFRALGVSAIVAESFGAIYKRNAINSGMAITEASGVFGALSSLKSGEEVEFDFDSGEITTLSGNFQAKPMSEVQKQIYLAGDLFAYAKSSPR